MSTRMLSALAGCIVAACVLVSPSADARLAHSTTCGVTEGSVDGYLPTAGRTCGVVIVAAPLSKTETISTGSVGQFTFHTNHLALCRESASTSDQILPTSTVAILHTRGTTWCRHHPDSPKTYLTTRNARILTTGTIIGLTIDDRGTLVRLAEGSASVTSLVSRTVVQVKSGSQVLVPFAGRPAKVTPLVLSPDDALAVAEMRSDVVQLGLAQVPQHAKALTEGAVVVIGDTPASAKALAARLRPLRTDALNADQVRSDPTIVATELKRLGSRSVVTTGPLEAVDPLWQLLRSSAQLPTGTSVLYVAP